MKPYLITALLLIPAIAQAQEWQSSPQQTDLIELFTSEGCSSCPPADHWLNSLKDQPGLFTAFIPMAFHVDYWDSIGWKDRLANPQYSERQRQYVRSGQVSQVYTPGFVINSEEWRPWFRGARNWTSSTKNTGVLKAKLDNRQLDVYFDHDNANQLNVAYLGMGVKTNIKAGENRGRSLTHDFVVMSVTRQAGSGHWQLMLPEVPDVGQEKTAVAIWVSLPHSQQVVQAVGGYLE